MAALADARGTLKRSVLLSRAGPHPLRSEPGILPSCDREMLMQLYWSWVPKHQGRRVLCRRFGFRVKRAAKALRQADRFRVIGMDVADGRSPTESVEDILACCGRCLEGETPSRLCRVPDAPAELPLWTSCRKVRSETANDASRVFTGGNEGTKTPDIPVPEHGRENDEGLAFDEVGTPTSVF